MAYTTVSFTVAGGNEELTDCPVVMAAQRAASSCALSFILDSLANDHLRIGSDDELDDLWTPPVSKSGTPNPSYESNSGRQCRAARQE